MESKPKVKEAVEWYIQNKVIYEALCERVESIIKEVLDLEKINYHSVTSRAKSIESYKLKASKPKYRDPCSEIMDMAGLRVITYTDSDAKRVFEVIKSTFELYPTLSSDKTEELGVDKVGYRSLDCIATLGKERLKLPENRLFRNIRFEIQIRTILQHAWAEFEHDRNYKFKGLLPKDLRRRLSLVAGSLESIDREFDNLSKEIDAYSNEVEQRTDKGDLGIPIDSVSLTAFLNEKFRDLVSEGIINPDLTLGEVTIEELSLMGIDSLKKLDDVIPKDFAEKTRSFYLAFLQRIGEQSSFSSIVIDILIIYDANLYFQKAWNDRWQGIDRETVELICSYGIDFEKYRSKYNLDVF
jgi:ppGpp synthetase/RelA/SpoT-type nucleotidyltranferase